MVTYSVNLNLNKLAVVETTISSAVSILAAAGLNEGEIAAQLRRAAGQLESGDQPDELSLDDWKSNDHISTPNVYDLLERYEQTPEKRALERLSKRASALGYAQDGEHLEKAFDILSQALPLAAAAQAWVIKACSNSGIQCEPSKDEWLETATDEELDRENEIIFLDDWQISHDFQLQQIEMLARSFAHSGNIEGYRRLVTLLGSNKVLYGTKAMAEVSKAGDAFESMADFMDFLAEHAGNGEWAQSTLLDDYVLRSGFTGGTYMLEGWLDSLASEGRIQRYKRSNRWRIIVGSA